LDQTLANWLTGKAAPLVVGLVVASLLIWFPYRLIAPAPLMGSIAPSR
jgi:hypothetical protein